MIRASSGKTAARRLLVGAGALALLVATVGCEAGEDAPTLEFHAASSGAYTVFNGIKITDAFVLGGQGGAAVPAGGSASMFLSLYNTGGSPDELTAISAPGSAGSVSLTGGTVALPGYGVANLMGPEPKVVFNDLKEPLTGGTDIPVTLSFAHAGSVTLQVPVEAQSDYWSTYSPPPASPAASVSPSTTATPAASPSTSASATATA